MNDIKQHLFSFVNPDSYVPVSMEVTPEAKTVAVLTVDKLKKFAPRLQDATARAIVDAIASSAVLKTPLQIAHFLAQAAHESNEFTVVQENMNYSEQGLAATFSKYFPTAELRKQYARKPEKIGNRVYANRMGNGPESSGDGYLLRGRGYLQLTGSDNYTAYSRAMYGDLRIRQNPSKVAEPYDAIRSSIWFWSVNNVNKYADKDDVLAVSRLVNVGNANSTVTPRGLDDRKKKLEAAKKVLGI